MNNRVKKIDSKEVFKCAYFSALNETFIPGDLIRSYRSAFDSDFPFKNDYIEGVVLKVEDSVGQYKDLLVKWTSSNHFGIIGSGKLPHNDSDTWSISTGSPHLFKMNKLVLAI